MKAQGRDRSRDWLGFRNPVNPVLILLILLRFLGFVGLGFALAACGQVARAELRAGAARVEITPDVKAMPVPLGGYAARRGAPATGVHDPVYARALVLSDGATKVGIVSLDLCFLPANVKAEVLRRVEAAGLRGLDSAHLLLAATHTHSAPDPLAMHRGNTFTAIKGWTHFDRRLLDFTADRIAQALVTAEGRMVPARIGSGAVALPGRNRNRRGDPVTDPELIALKVETAEGRPLAAIVNFAAHPTLYDDRMMDISADWPGIMTGRLEQKMGAGAVCLFLNGAEGDASPNGVDDKPAGEKVAAYGEALADAAWSLLKGLNLPSEVPLAAWMQAVTLPPRKPNALFLIAAAELGCSLEQAKALVAGLMPTTTQIGFVRVGDLLLMGFPCEPSGALGLAAKAAARKAGFQRPAVVALANDWLAYALTPEQYRAGKYEAGMSFYGDQFGPTLLTALQNGLQAK